MRLPSSAISRLGIVGLAALTTAGCDTKITRAVTAEVVVLNGLVVVSRAEGGRETPGGSATTLAGGDTLRTGSNGAAAVRLLPGALLHLPAESAFQLTNLTLSKNGNATDEAMSRNVAVELVAGTVDVVLQYEPDTEAFRLVTATGTVETRAPGTCRVQATREGIRLTVLRGNFDFITAGSARQTHVEAGYFFQTGLHPEPPRGVETTETAQADIDQLLEVERKLLEWQRAQRAVPFPWHNFQEAILLR